MEVYEIVETLHGDEQIKLLRLDRQNKAIIQGTEHYGVPMNTELLVQIMIGILQGE